MSRTRSKPKTSLSVECLEARAVPAVLAFTLPTEASPDFPTIRLPAGFRIEQVATGLTYPTASTFDDQGRLYVAEAGGGFLEEPPPARILRVENGAVAEVVNLGTRVGAAVAGMTFYQGSFLITHRDPVDGTGAVSRVDFDGTVTRLLSGVVDSRSEHQLNDVRVGPDGRVYVASGPAFNSAVAGLDNAPFLALYPDLRPVPTRDLVLRGVNFETPDFRTEDDETDVVRTGAYVPFGTPTTPGQVIPGNPLGGGAILVFDLADPQGTVTAYADGFRNIIGLTWDSRGELFAAVNGADVRGSRPVNDEFDGTYRVREGVWYGWPEFSAALQPLTDPRFDSPDSLQAPAFLNGVLLPSDRIPSVVDLEASGLSAPDRALVAGLHRVNASPSLLDVGPAGWGRVADQLFIAEWGDLAPETTPLRDRPAGFQVVRVNPATGQLVPFVVNAQPGPASRQGAPGRGIERPYDVRFGPDGAMYIVDFGVVRVNPAKAGPGDDPYEYPPRTGVVWRVTREAPAPGSASTPGRAFVSQLFRDLLGRAPDPDALASLGELVDSRAVDRADLARAVQESPEARTRVARTVYRQFLDRDGTPDELAAVVARLDRGESVEDLVAGVLGSDEYFRVRGRGTPNGFAVALYSDVLFRAAETSELEAVAQALFSGASREDVARGLLGSREADALEARTVYFQLLGREADPAGLEAFIAALQFGVRTEDIFPSIFASKEYGALAGGPFVGP